MSSEFQQMAKMQDSLHCSMLNSKLFSKSDCGDRVVPSNEINCFDGSEMQIYSNLQKFAALENHTKSKSEKTDHLSNYIEHRVWEGHVEEIEKNELIVCFHDKNDLHQIPRYQVKFGLTELSPEDRGKVMEGSFVCWKLGYEIMSDGSKRRVSSLHVVKFPPISKHEIENARKEASNLLDGIT